MRLELRSRPLLRVVVPTMLTAPLIVVVPVFVTLNCETPLVCRSMRSDDAPDAVSVMLAWMPVKVVAPAFHVPMSLRPTSDEVRVP